MKCRIREIITTASAVALTVAAAPAATAYAASVDDAQAVISENVGEAVAVTRLATSSETTTWNKAVTLTEDTVVDGNLNITANVDLNGYTLTVNGDINHSAGTITCNNGILNVILPLIELKLMNDSTCSLGLKSVYGSSSLEIIYLTIPLLAE